VFPYAPRHRPRAPLLLPALAACGLLASRCAFAQGGGETDRHYPVTDPKNFTRVVATVGGEGITAQEFLLNYEFGPAFAKREKDSRSRYLDFMIDEKLLARDARDHGLMRSPRVLRSLEVLEGDMATEELYKDDVLSRVQLTPAEIARGVRDGQVHYALQWLYAPDSAAANALTAALGKGTPFDTLLAGQLAGGVKRDDRTMEATLFRLRRTSPLLAAVAESLRAGRASRPVRGPDGFYVLRVARGWRDVSLSATEREKLVEDARRALTEEKADSLSDLYVRRMMLDRNPVIVRVTFDRLEAWLAGTWAKPDRYAAWELASRVGIPADSAARARIEALGSDTLVALSGRGARRGISLGEFLSWYRARDTYFTLDIANEQAFFLSVQNLVWRMVRDRLLVERALQRNLQSRDQVRKQLRWWEDKVLYGEEKLLLGSTIVLTDSAIRAYYDANTRDYRADSGRVEPYAGVKARVRKDYYEFELKKNMLHALVALRRKYPVDIRKDVLQALPVDIENNPKAIDVYVAKKGGTFPHPAFPVIDYAWASWM